MGFCDSRSFGNSSTLGAVQNGATGGKQTGGGGTKPGVARRDALRRLSFTADLLRTCVGTLLGSEVWVSSATASGMQSWTVWTTHTQSSGAEQRREE